MKLNQKISTKLFIVSHILILICGLIFLGWLYYILYLTDYTPQIFSQSERVFTQKPKSLLLDLNQPEDVLIFEPSILISGKTNPNTDILIMTDSAEVITKSKKDGNFSSVVDLSEGITRIVVVAFNSDESRSSERSVYYSKEKI